MGLHVYLVQKTQIQISRNFLYMLTAIVDLSFPGDSAIAISYIRPVLRMTSLMLSHDDAYSVACRQWSSTSDLSPPQPERYRLACLLAVKDLTEWRYYRAGAKSDVSKCIVFRVLIVIWR